MQSLLRKFSLATRGIREGVRGQSSFAIHIPVALGVVLLAFVLRCALWQWCALISCIGLVMAAELANSAIEELAAGLCREHNPQVGRALDIAAGSVLVASLTAAVIGCLVFISRLASL